MRAVVNAGRFGRKGKLGFYVMTRQQEGRVDSSVYGSAESRRLIRRGEIQQRCALALANEAAELSKKNCPTPRDSRGAVFGGFPPFRGGPFRWMIRWSREGCRALEISVRALPTVYASISCVDGTARRSLPT
jgi:hypothetical protein